MIFLSILGGTISRSATTQVNIHAPGNSKPQFLQKVYQGTVEEEQEPGAGILTVTISVNSEKQMFLQTICPTDGKSKFTYRHSPKNELLL